MGRPPTRLRDLPEKHQNLLAEALTKHHDYVKAQNDLATVRETVAAQTGHPTNHYALKTHPLVVAYRETAEHAASERLDAIKHAINSGVSKYRVAKTLGFKSGTAHINMLLKAEAGERRQNVTSSKDTPKDS